MLPEPSVKPDFISKSSCGDLQSRLKVRKVLGVGDSTGSTCTSKIRQILGNSDQSIFHLPANLTTWLLVITGSFVFVTITGFLWPSCLRFILPGAIESTHNLAASYAFFATILALTIRSGDKTSLQLVLSSLIFFHVLSSFIAFWFFKMNETRMKSSVAMILHSACAFINLHFYRMIAPFSSSYLFHRYQKFKSNLSSMFSVSSTSTDHPLVSENSSHLN